MKKRRQKATMLNKDESKKEEEKRKLLKIYVIEYILSKEGKLPKRKSRITKYKKL